jgi:hypothetical protein
MRHFFYSLLILFSLFPDISFAGDQAYLARQEVTTDLAMTGFADIGSVDYDWRFVRNTRAPVDRVPQKFSGSEIGDEVLGSVQGKSIETTLPTYQAEQSGIILWDEAKLQGSKGLNLGNGRNLNFSARR